MTTRTIKTERDRRELVKLIESRELPFAVDMNPERKRTSKQNSSLHVYCRKLADALNNAGLDMRRVMKPEYELPWSTYSVKDFLWRPIQDAILRKKSTTELTTVETQEVYKVLDANLGEKFGVSIPWPSKESQMMEAMGDEYKA